MTNPQTTDRKRERESDEARFLDLLAEHNIKCRKIRSRYYFEDYDFTAQGFNQAYGFVEAIDRTMKERLLGDVVESILCNIAAYSCAFPSRSEVAKAKWLIAEIEHYKRFPEYEPLMGKLLPWFEEWRNGKQTGLKL